MAVDDASELRAASSLVPVQAQWKFELGKFSSYDSIFL